MPGSGGAHVYTRHSGGRSRQIPVEFEASLVYKASSRTVRATQKDPVLKTPNKQIRRLKKVHFRTMLY